MPAKHYCVGINETTLPLITFLNDGREPVVPKKMREPTFLFTIDSPNEITVSRNSVISADDIWEPDGKCYKAKYRNYESLIG